MPEEQASDNSLAEGFAALQLSRLREHKITHGDQPPIFNPPEGTMVCHDPKDGRKDLLSCALVHRHPRGSWHDTVTGYDWELAAEYLLEPAPCSVHGNGWHAHLESHYRHRKSSPRRSAQNAMVFRTTGSNPSEWRARPGLHFRKNDLVSDVYLADIPRPLIDEPPIREWQEYEHCVLHNCQTDGWDKHTKGIPHLPEEATVDWQLEGQHVNKAWCPTHEKEETFLTSRYGRMMPWRQIFDDSRRNLEPPRCSQEEEARSQPITMTPITQNPGEFRLASPSPQPRGPLSLQTCDGDGPPPDFPWFDPGRASFGWIPGSSSALEADWCPKHEKNETRTRREYLPVASDQTTQRSYRPHIDDPKEVRKQPLLSDAPTLLSYGDGEITTHQPSSAAQRGPQDLTHRPRASHP
jgi:hypothetical protein